MYILRITFGGYGLNCFLRIVLFAGLFLASEVFSNNDRIPIQGKDIFLSGINVAWDRYANDVGDIPINLSAYREVILKTRAAGGNTIRMWLSTNGKNDPKFDPATGLVNGLGSETISNVQRVLDFSYENGVVVSLCLLSHNLLQDGQGAPISNNIQMLKTDEGIQAYIDNALLPLVSAIGYHPAIATWEIFNEPEGMLVNGGWTDFASIANFGMLDLQKFINRVAGAIKSINPNLLVSNGAQTFKYSANVGVFENNYSDSALIEAGGDPLGVLDFYQVHFYPNHQGDELSPFHHPADYWGLDKPIVIGEFPNAGVVPIGGEFKTSSELNTVEAYKYLFDNGYAGALSWCYKCSGDLGSFEEIKPALKNLYTQNEAQIYLGELNYELNHNQYAMQLEIKNLSQSASTLLQVIDESMDPSQDLTLRVKLAEVDSGESIELRWVTQSGNSFTWISASQSYEVPQDGAWHTFTLPISELNGTDFSYVRNLRLEIKSSTTQDFSGLVWIDDIQQGSKVISDFNDSFGLWSPLDTKIETVSAVPLDADGNKVGIHPGLTIRLPEYQIVDNKIHFIDVNPQTKMKVFNIHGRVLDLPHSYQEGRLIVDIPNNQNFLLIRLQTGNEFTSLFIPIF